jgi:hypothetical protein
MDISFNVACSPRHDGSSVSGEIARKFRSENFWDFTKSMDFFGIIRLVMGEQVTLNEMSIYIMGEEVTLNIFKYNTMY